MRLGHRQDVSLELQQEQLEPGHAAEQQTDQQQGPPVLLERKPLQEPSKWCWSYHQSYHRQLACRTATNVQDRKPHR